MCNKNKQSGFTLVELAIVIVIIGFIVAGIAAGSSLIKQAQIRSVVTDFTNFQVAYNNFLGRYNSVPGDFSNAESYWPAGTNSTSCAATGISCNGNGNGLIEFSTTGAAGGISETRLAWRQLALAGMLNAGITQIATDNTLTNNAMILSTRAPISKISGAGYAMAGYNGTDFRLISAAAGFTGDQTRSPWTGTGKNAVFIGRAIAAAGDSTGVLGAGAMNPEDAFAIDQKMDDGSISGANFTGADTGVIRTVAGANSAPGAATECVDNTSATTRNLYRVSDVTAVAFEGCLVGFQLN